MTHRWVYRVVGPPPGPDAARETQLRWIRKFYRFNLIAIAVVVILAVGLGGSLLWITAAAVAFASALGFASTSRAIRREHAAESSPE